MASEPHFCGDSACISPAVRFCFLNDAKQFFCEVHTPAVAVQFHSIDLMDLIGSVEDEVLFVVRGGEVERLKTLFERVAKEAEEDVHIGKEELNREKNHAVEVVQRAYEAESRRLDQHLCHIQSVISGYQSLWTDYVTTKDATLPPVLRLLCERDFPILPLSVHSATFDCSTELVEIIEKSCVRNHSAFDTQLEQFLIDNGDRYAALLVEESQKEASKGSFLCLKTAENMCKEALRVANKPEFAQFFIEIQEKMTKIAHFRSDFVRNFLGKDAQSVSELILRCKNMGLEGATRKEIDLTFGIALNAAIKHSESSEVAESCYIYGNWLRREDINRPKESRKWLKTSLKLQTRICPTSLQLALIFNSLAGLYLLSLPSQPKAYKYLQKAVMLTSELYPSTLLHAQVCMSLGYYYYENNSYSHAEEYYLKAYTLFRERFREEIDYLATISNVGLVLYSLGKRKEAEEKALEVMEMVKGEDKGSYVSASTLNLLGMIYVETGRLDEAEKCLTSAFHQFHHCQLPRHFNKLASDLVLLNGLKARKQNKKH